MVSSIGENSEEFGKDQLPVIPRRMMSAGGTESVYGGKGCRGKG